MKRKQFRLILILDIVLLLVASACSTSQGSSEPEPDFGMNEPVENGEYRITVEVAEEHGTEFTNKAGATIWTYEEDSHYFFVQIYLEHLSGEDVGHAFLNKAVVRDSKGNTYEWYYAGTPLRYFGPFDDYSSVKLMQPTVENHYIFVVPDGVEILDFIWADFPAVRLTIE